MSVVGSEGEELSVVVYNKLRRLIYKQCGITLGDNKLELVKSRLSKRMRKIQIERYSDYYKHLTSSKEEMTEFLNAISTNTTHFFRESAHFDFMDARLKEWYAGGQRKFRFWSAACSSGEEPYTMAIMANELFHDKSFVDWRILATDISTGVLQKCQEGVYHEKQFVDMPKQYLRKYVTVQGESYHIEEKLKKYISFNRINLNNHPFPMKGPFDLVFCRNVMIYFDEVVRKQLIMDIHRLLGPNGYLLVGHAESLTGLGLPFELVQPAVYKKL